MIQLQKDEFLQIFLWMNDILEAINGQADDILGQIMKGVTNYEGSNIWDGLGLGLGEEVIYGERLSVL